MDSWLNSDCWPWWTCKPL